MYRSREHMRQEEEGKVHKDEKNAHRISIFP